jgi:hypothetical protein
MSSLKTVKGSLIFLFSLLVYLFAVIPEYALAANPNAVKDSDTMKSATLVCGGAYWVNQSIKSTGHENAAYWSIRNINDDQSLFIDRIRVHDYDGGLFRDYRWTGASFEDALGSGTSIPPDGNGNISGTDNELGPMQPIAYGHQMLFEAGVIPEHLIGNPNQVTLLIDWYADEYAYPLSGSLTRQRGEVYLPAPDDHFGVMGRASYECKVINKVFK